MFCVLLHFFTSAGTLKRFPNKKSRKPPKLQEKILSHLEAAVLIHPTCDPNPDPPAHTMAPSLAPSSEFPKCTSVLFRGPASWLGAQLLLPPSAVAPVLLILLHCQGSWQPSPLPGRGLPNTQVGLGSFLGSHSLQPLCGDRLIYSCPPLDGEPYEDIN